MAVRAREKAVRNLDRGDYSTAKQVLQNAQNVLYSAPMSDAVKAQELAELEELDQQLERGEIKKCVSKLLMKAIANAAVVLSKILNYLVVKIDII